MESLQVILAGAVVLLVPGMSIAWLLGLTRVLPIALLPAALTVCSLTAISALLWAALVFEQPIRVVWGGLGGLAGAVTIALLIRALERTQGALGLAVLVRRTWGGLRSLGIATPAIALTTGAYAYALGGTLRGDALYHAAQSLKLERLPHPSLSNTTAFVNGSGHPGYYLPAWHEALALIARLAHNDIPTVMLVLPALMAAIATLAAGGLAQAVFRMPIAAPFGALAFALTQVLTTAPASFAATQAAYPREVATDIVLPVAVASAFAAAWTPVDVSNRSGRSLRRGALGCLVLATAMLIVVHVSYVLFLAIALTGYAIVWALNTPAPRAVARSHLAVAIVAGVVALAGVGSLLPQLRGLDSFAQNSRVERVMTGTLDAPEIPKGLRLGELFQGTKHAYHLRPDYLVWYGALSLLGLCCAVLTLGFRCDPAAWLIGGWTLLVGALALRDELFPLLIQAMGTSQAKRIALALPIVLGLTLGLLVLARSIDAMWTARARQLRTASLVATALVAIGVAVLSHSYPLLTNPLDPAIPAWPVRLTIQALAVGVGVIAMLWIIRIFRWMRTPRRRRETLVMHSGDLAPLILHPPRRLAASLAAVALITGSAPSLARGLDDARTRWQRRADRARSTGSLHRFDDVSGSLDRLNPGMIAMAEPEVAHELMALAPVYVVSSLPGHTANTPRNRIYERYELVQRFYTGDETDADRLDVLRDEHVDVLVLRHDRHGRELREFVDRNRDRFEVIARGTRLTLWRFER